MKKPIVILGGGLWGGLVARTLTTSHREVPYVLYERGSTLGGSHTWSFHETDVSPAELAVLGPLITKSWKRHSVHFPQLSKSFNSGYHSITSERFHSVLMAELGSEKIRLETERPLKEALEEADFVIDARGIHGTHRSGFQKFLGLELELEDGHGVEDPVIMDSRVPQIDGLRFLYFLPWSESRVLVEDTRFSNGPELDEAIVERDILEELGRRGLRVKAILGRERGVIPIPLEPEKKRSHPRVIDLGGIFHDTTGYSLPFAARLTTRLRSLPALTLDSFRNEVVALKDEHRSNRRFFRFLNHLMLKTCPPTERWRMLRFFYRRDQELISRFFAGSLSTTDQLRFFCGKPPLPVLPSLAYYLRGASK